VGNAADAEDVLQETFAAVFRTGRQFRGQASVATWLTRILVIQAAVARRARKRWRKEADPELAMAPEAENAGQVTAKRIDVQVALGQLSEEHRQVLVLREFAKLSYEEIASVLGVPRGTVESRLHRARGEMRTKLAVYLTE